MKDKNKLKEWISEQLQSKLFKRLFWTVLSAALVPLILMVSFVFRISPDLLSGHSAIFPAFLIITLLALIIAAIISNVAQVGLEIHGQAMKPSLGKLNPISGMKKFVSLKSLVELAKSMAKIVIVGGIAYAVVKSEMQHFPALMQKTVVDILQFILSAAFKIFFYV